MILILTLLVFSGFTGTTLWIWELDGRIAAIEEALRRADMLPPKQ